MKAAKLWLQVFMAGFAVIIAMLIVTLNTPIPYGDLTRIGLISDHQFGWRIEPPKVDRQYLRASPVQDADILVIGDSFSMSYRWQSMLTREGYRVTTIYWGQLPDEALCDDFDAWLDQAGFRGKLIVIESIERLFARRLANTQACRKMQKPFEYRLEPLFEHMDHVPHFALNWGARLTSGLVTYQNMRRAMHSDGSTPASNGALIRPVVDGCAMFSNLMCNKSLFFTEDEDNGELTAEHVAQMKAFTEAHPSRSIMWMIIPNKTTTYIQPNHSEEFVAALTKSGLGPDLFTFAQEKKTKIRDFFFPNDTHMSMFGQLALGEFMLEAIRKILPQPPAKAS